MCTENKDICDLTYLNNVSLKMRNYCDIYFLANIEILLVDKLICFSVLIRKLCCSPQPLT